MMPAARALNTSRSRSVERASSTIIGNREGPNQWVMMPARVRVWSCAAAASRYTRLTVAPVVPDEVTTLNTRSSGMLRNAWLLNRPTGSIGTSASDPISSGRCPSAQRIRAYAPERSRCSKVNSRSRSVSTTCFCSCGSEYWATSRRSSTCIAFCQSFVVDLAGSLQRKLLDIAYRKGTRVQAEALRDLAAQLISRHLRTRQAPQQDLLSPVHYGDRPVNSGGRLDLVEVHAKAEDLRDPLGTPSDAKEAILVER